MKMTLANAKVLFNHFMDIGRFEEAAELVARYPVLEDKRPELLVEDSVEKVKKYAKSKG